MKRLISIIMILAMCVAAFAACTTPETPEVIEDQGSITDAKNYLFTMYKDKTGKVLRDQEFVAVVISGALTFDIDWTVSVTAGSADDVAIVKDGKFITVDINEKPAEKLEYTLTATLTDAEGNKESVSFDYFVDAAPVASSGPAFVALPATAGVPYKYALRQENLGKYLYFTGKMSGNYLATSELAMDAVDVYLEEVEGGVRFYFFDGEAKMYIDIHEYTEGKAGVRITAEPSATFVYSEDAKTYVANVAGEDRYLGTYNTYNTISASATSYITGSNAEKVGVSQFVAGFCTVPVSFTIVEAPVAGVPYKYALRQENIAQDLYFTGKMSGNYLATTANPLAAADVYLEEVEGGVRFYFFDGEAKMYIDIHEYAEGKAGVRITAEPSATFVYSEDAKTYVANVAGEDRYLGTYNTYNTISASATSYITGSNAEKVGVSQFVCGFRTINFKNTKVEAPEAGKAYKFTLRQENIGQDLYFTGKMSGNYLATSANAMDAVDMYLEEVEGGVRFYFFEGETKMYIDIHEYTEGKAGVRITAEPSATFVYSEDAKTFVANVAGEDRYLGTYNTYNTVSASSTSYITGSNAEKVGVSQFVAYFAIVDIG